MTVSSEIYYYITDANKNIVALADSNGNVVNTYKYSPFGQVVATTGTVENPLQFSSEYFDAETELVYYNYRYYNPKLGRWLSRDPIVEIGGWNLHGICNNNVICYMDDLGHEIITTIVVGGGIILAGWGVKHLLDGLYPLGNIISHLDEESERSRKKREKMIQELCDPNSNKDIPIIKSQDDVDDLKQIHEAGSEALKNLPVGSSGSVPGIPSNATDVISTTVTEIMNKATEEKK